MCGRYALFHPVTDLANLFQSERLALEPRYNIAPTQDAPIIRPLADGRRELTMARWGLLPHWADPETFRGNLFNARSETAAEKPSFRDALRSGRCLVPASGFFEWQQDSRPKKPHFIRLRDGGPMLLAGLWSINTRGETPLLSFTVLTTRPNGFMEALHDRMPVILDEDGGERWLDPSIREPAMLEELFAPFPDGFLEAYPVDRRVGNPSMDEATLVEPLEG